MIYLLKTRRSMSWFESTEPEHPLIRACFLIEAITICILPDIFSIGMYHGTCTARAASTDLRVRRWRLLLQTARPVRTVTKSSEFAVAACRLLLDFCSLRAPYEGTDECAICEPSVGLGTFILARENFLVRSTAADRGSTKGALKLAPCAGS